MRNIKQFSSTLIFVFLISGCSSLPSLKFWGDDEEGESPAELSNIDQSLQIEVEWNKKLGIGQNFGRILPAISNDNAYFISGDGELYSLNRETGQEVWSRGTEDIVSGAISVGYKQIFYGTLDGEIVALDIKGNEIWRSQTSSEILAPPVTNGSIVAVQTADGKVFGFNSKNGEELWIHQSSIPKLTLRGTATPILEKGFIFTGFANGKVAMIYPDSGAIRLEIPVTMNEGKSELERVVDIDGKSIVADNLLVSASYQGNITAINLLEGKIAWQEEVSTIHDLSSVRSTVIAIDEKDVLKGFGLSSGAILWQQEGLKLRGLSSPVSIGSNFIVGDFEGYIHIINSKDGSFVARRKVSNRPILEIISEGKNLLIMDEAGRLSYLSVG